MKKVYLVLIAALCAPLFGMTEELATKVEQFRRRIVVREHIHANQVWNIKQPNPKNSRPTPFVKNSSENKITQIILEIDENLIPGKCHIEHIQHLQLIQDILEFNQFLQVKSQKRKHNFILTEFHQEYSLDQIKFVYKGINHITNVRRPLEMAIVKETNGIPEVVWKEVDQFKLPAE